MIKASENSLIYVEIGELNQLSFNKPPVIWAKNNLNNTVTMDFDNHSSRDVIDYYLQVVDKFDKIAVVLVNHSNQNPGNILTLFNRIIKKSKHYQFFHQGENSILSNLLKFSRSKSFNSFDEVKEEIAAYLN